MIRYLKWLYFLAIGLFIGGICMPMMTLSTFVLFENSISLLSGLYALGKDQQYLLLILISAVSLVLPALKFHVLYRILFHSESQTPQQARLFKLMHDYGRWGMLDVMVVALLVVTVKLGAIASVEIHTGLYVFSAAVLLIMLLTHLTERFHSKRNETI